MICMEDLLQGIGKRIRELRKNTFPTQPAAVEAINATPYAPGIQQPYLSELERSTGDKLPSARVLAALAVAFETNTDYILGLTNDEKPASDLEDQVVVGVRDPEERKLLQELTDLVRAMPREEQGFVLEVVQRLANQNKPRIIGSKS